MTAQALVNELATISGRVQNGVAWMNRRFPEWKDSIAPDDIDMSYDHLCILGQYGGSWNMCNEIWSEVGNSPELGFYHNDEALKTKPDIEEYYAALSVQWKLFFAGLELQKTGELINS